MNNDTISGLVFGLLAGTALGLGFGLLYAPQSGRRTRRELQKQAHEFRGKAEHFSDVVKSRAEEVGDTVSKGAEKYRREVKSKLG